MQLVDDVRDSLRAYPIFAFYLLITLAVAGFIGLMVTQMALGFEVFLPGAFGQMNHGATESHRVHDLTYGFLITTGVVGILAQLRDPSKNVAGMAMAVIPFGALVLAAVLSDQFDVVVRRTPFRLIAAVMAVVALLHPAGRHFFRSFRLSRINWVMVALVGIAGLPLLSYASTNIELQETVRDDHFFMGHYAFGAAMSFTIIGVGLLASMRPDGWKLTALVTGALPVLLGVSSLLFPDATSSLDAGWAVACIGWGVLFVTAAATTGDARDAASEPVRRPGRRPGRRTRPRTPAPSDVSSANVLMPTTSVPSRLMRFNPVGAWRHDTHGGCSTNSP